MKLYSYVITHDFGFAPNPYGGILTLATCMPRIRRCANVGDWLMGTGSVEGVGADKLIYLAKITKIVSMSDYGKTDQYKIKIPNSCPEKWSKRGDNIYFLNANDKWEQRNSHFHGYENMDHDLSGINVLVSKDFWYFGGNALTIHSEFKCLIKKGPNCKANQGKKEVQPFIKWVTLNKSGLSGKPSSITA